MAERSSRPLRENLELLPPPLPPGMRRVLEAIPLAEEQALLDLRGRLRLEPYVMRGQASRRRLAAFGGGYDGRFSGPPLPREIAKAREQVCRGVGLDPETFEQVIYTVYPPGAGIGWHIDLPRFGPSIVGLSLGAPARLRFRRRQPPSAGPGKVLSVLLPPRSVYVIGGEARLEWEHALSPVTEERVSITFRTLDGKGTRARA